MVAKIYSSTDVGAPVLNSATPGSFIALLDAILVNGYGTRDPLGWTKEFSGTNIAVYRNSTTHPGSSGMYLRVDDTAAYSSSMAYVQVTAYKTMSDISTGTEATHTVNWVRGAYNNGIQEWFCMGDERTFYINRAGPGTSYRLNSIFSAGDYKSYIPANNLNYYVTVERNGFTANGPTFFPQGTQSISVPRTATMSPIQTYCGPEFPPGSSWNPSPWGDRQIQPLRVVQNSVSGAVYAIGELRGAYATRENLNVATATGTYMGTNPFNPTEDLYDMAALAWTASNSGHILLTTGSWDG